MKYRPDIDGLRAIAVGSVLLYHGELLGATGGFVGVDIFFVISGYLITRILRDDIAAKRFSLTRFYDHRIRRILPAYAVVAIAATAAAYLILPPDELASFGRRLASTATFVSNILFRSESGYFARAAGDNPLLHTWSLSVEEQFYIAWPLLLFVLMRPRFARWRRAIFIACLLGSFALAVYAVSRRPLAAFFYSPLRAWELLMGAMVAMDYVPTLRRGSQDVAGTLGIVLILVPIFRYTNSTTVFPGAAALAPCLGAALVIAAGRDGPPLVNRALSWKPLVLTGLVSYSLYLWHWPILVFVRIYLGRELTSVDVGECLLASYALAVLSWIFIERRFRGRNVERVGLPRSIPVASAVLASLFALGVATALQNGWPARSNERADAAQLEMNIAARGVDGCMVDVARGVAPKRRGCLLGPGGESDVRAILLGDSHAGAYAAAVDRIAEERGFTVRQCDLPGDFRTS